MLEKEKEAIRGMVLAGNHGWAILALLDLISVQPTLTLDVVEESMRCGRLRHAIQEIIVKEEK